MKIKVDVSYTEKVIYREEIIFDEDQDDFIKEMKKEYDLVCKEHGLEMDISFEDFVKSNFYEFISITDYLSFSTKNIVETYDFDYEIENLEIEKIND